jgi:FKBP-type peptidyl-prolyl cis-trans isomerase FklB
MKRNHGMRRTLVLIALLGASRLLGADPEPALKDQNSKASYSIGANIGKIFKETEIPIDPELLLEGFKDAQAGKSKLTAEEITSALTELQRQVTVKRQEKQRQESEANQAAGEKFLAENKTKPGVITLPSGLQYKVLAEGAGESPGSNDIVTVNYRGTLINGEEFDSTAKTGRPLIRPLRALIPGWREAVALMKPGAKWELFVPPNLAYGPRGYPPKIGPNETLIFEVDLVSFTAPAPPKAAEVAPAPTQTQPVTSDIIKVPSREEMAKGAKIEVIKASDLEKLQEEQRKAQQQNSENKPEEKK